MTNEQLIKDIQAQEEKMYEMLQENLHLEGAIYDYAERIEALLTFLHEADLNKRDESIVGLRTIIAEMKS